MLNIDETRRFRLTFDSETMSMASVSLHADCTWRLDIVLLNPDDVDYPEVLSATVQHDGESCPVHEMVHETIS